MCIRDRFKIVTESKNFLIHKVSSLVFNATGTIIVSAFCGIYTAALYGNYASLYLMATGILLTQPFNALKSAVGNLLHEDISPERQRHLFEAISTAGDWYSLQIMLGFFLFTQPVMELWLGRKFLMPDGLVPVSYTHLGIVACCAAGVNLPYLGIQYWLGEKVSCQLPQQRVRMIRRLEEIFLDENDKRIYI